MYVGRLGPYYTRGFTEYDLWYLLKDGWVAQADPNQWSGYYGYGQGYDAYGYGTTQDPSLYAYGGYGYPQYPQQVKK